VAITRNGVAVGSEPVILDPQEVVGLTVRYTLTAAASDTFTIYTCALETASSVGVGSCISLIATAQILQRDGDVMRLSLSVRVPNGVPKTTTYVYVAVAEGSVPWSAIGSPPKTGDTFVVFDPAAGGLTNKRVLDTFLVSKTFTWR
jgi:hypothetical protein